MSILPAQCRAGRALLGISQQELAERANVARATLISFEAGDKLPRAQNLAAIRSALETAGVELVPEDGGGAGVRFRVPTERVG